MISHKDLKEVLHYNPETGDFTWVVMLSLRGAVGNIAGSPKNGYIRIVINGVKYRAHILAWFYMTGYWPNHQIDHKNRVRSDNRWCNLRPATSSQNNTNSKTRSDNATGYKNVGRNRAGYVVRVAGHRWFFSAGELDDAVAWAHKMREHYYGEFANHG